MDDGGPAALAGLEPEGHGVVVHWILHDLAIHGVRLLTNNPRKVDALTRLGVEVVERIPLIAAPNPHDRDHLRTKAARFGHDLPCDRVGSTPSTDPWRQRDDAF